MFCYQCQETIRNEGCRYRKGACGKEAVTADLQDLLVHTLKGIALLAEKADIAGGEKNRAGRFLAESLFATITNANFDNERFHGLISEAILLRDELAEKAGPSEDLPDQATWDLQEEEWEEKGKSVGVLTTGDEDIRSLRELVTYGLKGISAYADHAAVLGYEDEKIYDFLIEGLASTTRDLGVEEMVNLVLRTGEAAVDTMALLDRANTETYGHPEITEVNIGVRGNPGILISGHDLKDMEELLRQTEGTGVDIYTHSEMLPANYYPAFKKYDHFVGNYGNSWWKQNEEFEKFNGPILMTTNCIIPVKDSYADRIFTTGMAGWPGARHIPARENGSPKDFSEIIELAGKCDPPEQLETGTIVGGFAHNQVTELAGKVVEAVKEGKIKRFIVMAGCDGRHDTREYFTDVAGALPDNTVILTAGCAKYRYNKLDLGDIDGIPRVLDAGQCNDSYSLAVIAMKLKEAFQLVDINELPISFDIAWYEQKAVAVLLALLSLGIKGIRLGPTLPAFLSPGVGKVLVDKFGIRPVNGAYQDVKAMVAGK
ncbi:MAG: hydroxylamine reductase [Candidatus Latescibacteria bacterium]|nr:hydroxylamine reductase [bacterium]MBD3424330.1 hydroxylamine reductase [Candidatus Latescibacterota bacterium]